MARLAIVRQLILGVIGLFRLIVIGRMAGKALAGCPGKLAVCMTLITSDGHVSTGQRKTRQTVIE